MEINVFEEQGRVPVTIFKLVGRVNMGNADELVERANQAYQEGMRNLILDLSEVDSMTSAGLRAVLAVNKQLGSASGEPAGEAAKSLHLKLLNPSADLRRTLEVSGFASFLEIYEDKEAAVRSF